jgi:acyl-CoA reductase-like NAD-dependent aldehyde dehydrogenase
MGSPQGAGLHQVVSPVTGEVIGKVPLAARDELRAAVAQADAARDPWTPEETLGFLGRLRARLEQERSRMIELTLLETGFPLEQCAETVDGAIEYLQYFDRHVRDQQALSLRVPHSYASVAVREMRLLRRPYRRIAAMVPQNASLTLGVTIIASALHAGAAVLLRPSLQCGVSGELLAGLVEASQPPGSSVLIRNSLAREFLAAACVTDEIELIHYIGSNRHALDVFQEAFAADKVCLLDGQGNGMVYVDRSFPVEEAARLIVSGATRYNGETCTSINGVLVDEFVYPELRDAVVAEMRTLQVGDPRRSDTQIGPLFSEKQAEELLASLKIGAERMLCGGERTGAYCLPTIAEGVRDRSTLVREGLFGPALWLQSIERGTLPSWLRANRFPLSDTALAHDEAQVDLLVTHSRAARICINVDPSIESVFEPWGGYPGSGLNPVSAWPDKYRRVYQLDARAMGDVRSAAQG